MANFQERISEYCDARVSTLAKIKARSLDADVLTLTALKVLVYAQLEGGIKDIASCVLRDLNSRRLPVSDINPKLLEWRNSEDIRQFRSMVTFEMIAAPSPFGSALGKRLRVRGINRKNELNQMDWDAIRRVYEGLGLDHSSVEKVRGRITLILDDRNEAAHYGVLPTLGKALMEGQVRENADTVEYVLTDFSLKLLPFFCEQPSQEMSVLQLSVAWRGSAG
jgi:hypothetical protein